MRYTYNYGYKAHTMSGATVTVPDCVVDDQIQWDDSRASFPAIREDGSRGRAVVAGDAYGLCTAGTGDMVVRMV